MALRAAVDRLFRAIAHSERPNDRDLAAVWEEYAWAVAHSPT